MRRAVSTIRTDATGIAHARASHGYQRRRDSRTMSWSANRTDECRPRGASAAPASGVTRNAGNRSSPYAPPTATGPAGVQKTRHERANDDERNQSQHEQNRDRLDRGADHGRDVLGDQLRTTRLH